MQVTNNIEIPAETSQATVIQSAEKPVKEQTTKTDSLSDYFFGVMKPRLDFLEKRTKKIDAKLKKIGKQHPDYPELAKKLKLFKMATDLLQKALSLVFEAEQAIKRRIAEAIKTSNH